MTNRLNELGDYTPFGLNLIGIETEGKPDHKYQYNGKEKQEELGLNWIDYGARLYDAQLGRFHTQDRFAEKYYDLSQYQYAGNNPILNIDVNGDSIWVNDAGGKRYYYGYNKQTGYGFYSNSKGIGANGLPEDKMDLYTGGDAFIGQIEEALGKIMLGAEGKSLVTGLMSKDANMSIRQTAGGNFTDPTGAGIAWNPNSVSGGVDEEKSTTRPSYIGLAHELAHQKDIWAGTINNNPWVKALDPSGNKVIIPNADIYATHIENKVRAEHGLPLREFYSPTSTGQGSAPTRILKREATSKFYDLNGNTTFKRVKKPLTPFKYR